MSDLIGITQTKRKRKRLPFPGMTGKQSAWPLLVFLIIFLMGTAAGANLYHSKYAEIRFVSQLQSGWNLSNTLDCHGLTEESDEPEQYETNWGNPSTTKRMIDEIKKAGFSTLRVPVTWYEHMNEDYQIDANWMDRVQQVVDYGIENGMFVILNAHHDAWYTPEKTNLSEAEFITRRLWQQISRRFAEYDEKLLFEGMNEPRLIGTEHEWDAGTPEAREIVNRLNQVFIETVRSGSGYNKDRYLLLPTYCASTLPEALIGFQLPEGKRLIVSLHLYLPYGFTLDVNGTADWNRDKKQTQEIDQAFRDAKRIFTRRGIPVVISEFGAVDKNNTTERAEWVRYVRKLAAKQSIPCIWWDDSVFDRRSLKWNYPELVDALVSKS